MTQAQPAQKETPKSGAHSDAPALDAMLREIVRNAAERETLEDGVDYILDQLDVMPHLNRLFRVRYAQMLLTDARTTLRQRMERVAWTIPEHAAKAVSARLDARISLYDYPLPGTDVRLGDATVADLEAAAEYHRARAASEETRAGIYDGVARVLRRSKAETVRQGVTEEKIAEIMRGAQ
jgi:hypothetical protein